MNKLLFLFLSINLIIIFFQDMKHRLIHVGLIVSLFVITGFYWFFNSADLKLVLYNFMFISLNLLCLKLYTLVTNKEKTDDLIYGLGLGDILFFIAIIPLFGLYNYILFIISGLIISVITHLIISQFYQNKLIPLAGYLAVYLILFSSYLLYSNQNFYRNLI